MLFYVYKMDENKIANLVIQAAFTIHRELGPGLFESVYSNVMDYVLRNEYGLYVVCQPVIPVVWKGVQLTAGFRPDKIVENKVIVELKAMEGLAPVHFKQVLTYLKLSNLKLGLLINFNEELIKNGIRRIANGM